MNTATEIHCDPAKPLSASELAALLADRPETEYAKITVGVLNDVVRKLGPSGRRLVCACAAAAEKDGASV